ncbi:MAG TPA: DUF4931 domain-containing protein [Thermoanaerobaculia bacterium]|nr:DUF4931 domain-containing protein [Thermoanaerobaculia bacterium]
MASFRRNPITGEPVILAPQRAQRPNAFGGGSEEVCPFCPGNESLTPPEIMRVGTADAWTIRVIPNKYPLADARSGWDDDAPTPFGGRHEVVIESPDHDAAFESLSLDSAQEIARVWIARYGALAAIDGCASVAVFKNHGPLGGASLGHMHSQIVAMPFVPPRIAAEAAGFVRAGTCPLCDAIAGRHRNLIIEATAGFVRLAPYASAMPFQQWIVPKRHLPEINMLTDIETRDLAGHLRAAAADMTGVRRPASYNWLLMSFPNLAAGHFYVDAFPRLTALAGFELGTGCGINIVDPAEVARGGIFKRSG